MDWQLVADNPPPVKQWVLLWMKGFAEPVRGRLVPWGHDGSYRWDGNDFEGHFQFTHWAKITKPVLQDERKIR